MHAVGLPGIPVLLVITLIALIFVVVPVVIVTVLVVVIVRMAGANDAASPEAKGESAREEQGRGARDDPMSR